ncbi:hypothetical protein HOLleu_26933 [Holothuria leucospilota]|uniref:Uncharacterized protein n=1 Tax=Holothuria leucospilota TaxID=206669 RepID=A0A9Q1BPN5_HOLLE|nr:hypothetical protein HOLleu_26933 [Holothuria leucospilota]
MNNTKVVMRNGNDEIRLSFQRFVNPCRPANLVVRHKFDKFVDQDFQIGDPEPNFGFCDRHPIDNYYCTTAQSIKCKVHRASPNICQSSWKTVGRVSCETPLKITNVTKGFRDFMLFADGEIEVIASESYFGNFSMGLKYPCIE